MSGSVNKVIIIGNLGRDPESRSFQNGGKVVNLRVACSESWKDRDSGERKERTEWVSVAIFNEGLARTAEQYLRKGSKVYLEGKLQTRKWQDSSGADKYSTEVVLAQYDGKLVLLGDGPGGAREDDRGDRSDRGGRRDNGRSSDGGFGRGGAQRNVFDDDLDDDVPFATSCPTAREPGTSRRRA